MVTDVALARPTSMHALQTRASLGDDVLTEFVERHMRQRPCDPMVVACNAASDVCMALFNVRVAVMPPHPDAPEFLRELWERTLLATDEAFSRRGMDPTVDAVRGPGVPWRLVSTVPESPDLGSYPWSEPAIDIDGVPAPSTFCKVHGEMGDAELLRQCVLRALEMAGADYEVGIGDNKVGKRLRREMRSVILASPWNRARVTSRNANFAGGNDPDMVGGDRRVARIDHMMGPDGLGLVLGAMHKDDFARLSHGLPASRNVRLDGARIGAGSELPVLWIPAVNLHLLHGASPTISTSGMTWGASGRNTLHPPPAVDNLGIDTQGVELPPTENAP